MLSGQVAVSQQEHAGLTFSIVLQLTSHFASATLIVALSFSNRIR